MLLLEMLDEFQKVPLRATPLPPFPLTNSQYA